MRTVADYSFSGQRALVRVDFNVPLNDKFEVTDDTRIRAALPTIRKIQAEKGAIILMSHLGRPKGEPSNKYSLKHLVPVLNDLLRVEVKFADDCIGESAQQMAASLEAGEVLLLENLRFYNEETKGDKDFAKKLAALGDVYVNDAFGTAHRAHASTAVVADYFSAEKKMFGFLMAKEVENGHKVLHGSQKPFTAILGGAKVSDKILIIENLMNVANNIIIGGGMAYTFIKAKGGNIGNSLFEPENLEVAQVLFQKAEEQGVKILLPVDAKIADKFDAEAQTQIADGKSIPDGWMGLDIGPQAMEEFAEVIKSSKTILWNGPMGVFEMEPFAEGTKAVAKAVAGATANGAYSLVGGGDSVAAVNQLGLADDISYVSTGGGAMLELLEGKQLPGIEAIEGSR